jgi:predicted nucleic acid-binding protein
MVNSYFLDSSVLVKRYVIETGTKWVREMTSPDASNRIILARITWVEVISALARRQREGTVSAIDITKAIRNFRHHIQTQYQVVELDHTLAESASELLRKHPLRAYDAVQLASALYVQRTFFRVGASNFSFVSADNRLLTIAATEGLLSDNPLTHP